jgi:hypothetical protein
MVCFSVEAAVKGQCNERKSSAPTTTTTKRKTLEVNLWHASSQNDGRGVDFVTGLYLKMK